MLHFCILLYYPIMNISAFGDKKLKKAKKILFLKIQVAKSLCTPVKTVSSANFLIVNKNSRYGWYVCKF